MLGSKDLPNVFKLLYDKSNCYNDVYKLKYLPLQMNTLNDRIKLTRSDGKIVCMIRVNNIDFGTEENHKYLAGVIDGINNLLYSQLGSVVEQYGMYYHTFKIHKRNEHVATYNLSYWYSMHKNIVVYILAYSNYRYNATGDDSIVKSDLFTTVVILTINEHNRNRKNNWVLTDQYNEINCVSNGYNLIEAPSIYYSKPEI